MFGPALAGLLSDLYGLTAPLWFLATVAVLGGITALFLRKQRRGSSASGQIRRSPRRLNRAQLGVTQLKLAASALSPEPSYCGTSG